MTAISIRKRIKEIKALSLLVLTITVGLMFSSEMSEYVTDGMELAVRCVIPSSFPFMIIADFYTHYGSPDMLGLLGSLISNIFGIPKHLIGVFICGNVGGFPIAAKMASEIYKNKEAEKEEIERLIPLASNPSCAFLLGGVGMGMYKNLKIGFILLSSVYVSMLLCAILTRKRVIENKYSNNNVRQKYNFVSSVKQSGISCVSLISFISIFSVAVGLVENHIKNPVISTVIITLLEVTNALKIFSSSSLFPLALKLGISGFALGFGGLSVMLQSAVFISETDLRMKKYLAIKLFQGLICGSMSTLFTFLL